MISIRRAWPGWRWRVEVPVGGVTLAASGWAWRRDTAVGKAVTALVRIAGHVERVRRSN